MTSHDRKKLSELVLFIIDKTGGVDFYHAFKILYFAEMKHLAKWGSGFVPDEFCALKYGPVPTHLYDAVKELNHPQMILSEELSEVIQYAGEDAPDVLQAAKKFHEQDAVKVEAARNGTSNRAWVSKTIQAKNVEFLDRAYGE